MKHFSFQDKFSQILS